jgi:acetyl-CoA carboxylase biotin carboxyl carrier protein
MNFEDIERILELVRQHELAEFELEIDGLKLRVQKAGAAQPAMHQLVPAAAMPATPQAPAPPSVLTVAGGTTAGQPGPPAAGPLVPEEDTEVELAVVKSPIVGTFYRSAEPGSAPFVDVGDRVRKDQVLCIIEAMKLMNEITSEYEGEIVSVYVENGKPVQYGERLFAIRTT